MKYHDELVKIFGKAMEDNHIKNDTISLLEQGLSLEEITEYWKNPKNLKIINQANEFLISGRAPLKPAIYPSDFEEQYKDDGYIPRCDILDKKLEAELAHDDDVDPTLMFHKGDVFFEELDYLCSVLPCCSSEEEQESEFNKTIETLSKHDIDIDYFMLKLKEKLQEGDDYEI